MEGIEFSNNEKVIANKYLLQDIKRIEQGFLGSKHEILTTIMKY